MKRLLTLVLLLLPTLSHAQDLSILTNLHPRPQVSWLKAKGGPFLLDKSCVIVTSDSAYSGTLSALAYFERNLKTQLGDTLAVVRASDFSHDHRAIYLGQNIDFAGLLDTVSTEIPGISLSNEMYKIASNASTIRLAAPDSVGEYYAVATFLQLAKISNNIIPALDIWDWPDYPLRWVFSMHNMMVQSQVDNIKAIEDSMAAHKLNGLQQNDFKYSILDFLDSYYYSHVDSMRVHAEQNNIEVIPGVVSIGYSQGELIHDPDMAEGFPTTCRYIIESDTGRLLGDPRVTVPNGNFENANGTTFPGWGWVDTTVHVETSGTHSGQYCARVNNFTSNAPNGRFIKMLTCLPHHGYRMSAWVKTQGFRGEFNLLAIGFHGSSSRALTYTQFGVPQDQPTWQQANVIFNTLDYDSLYVYCGVWSGSAGTIWMDDFTIEDAGMVNMLRRSDQLPSVTGPAGKYAEGTDYAKLVDAIMEQQQGSYTWHPSPTLRILSGSKIHNGDTVQVSFIRANPVLNYPNGDGSTMVCVSEDTLYSIIHDQVRRVDSLLHQPTHYMISHDEIRQMNWDSACNARHLSAAALLADNVRKCDSIVSVVHPNAEKFDWSDMFDSLHNAHNNYYLVNGDLTGDWNLIPKDLTIINWNSTYMDSSLAFFERHGFNQMTSPYYDEHDTRNIREWRKAMERHPNTMRGMMYTTWAADYSYLTPFADYAWSAGPMIVHRPLNVVQDSIVPYKYQVIVADVFADPYDATDRIDSVTFWQYLTLAGQPKAMSWKMQHDSGSRWRFVTDVQSDAGTEITYQIIAKDREGITRATPRYFLFQMPEAPKSVAESSGTAFAIYPNPASDRIELSRSRATNAEIEVVNAVGAVVKTLRLSAEQGAIDIKELPEGVYTLRIKDGAELQSRSFVIVR